jgi:signal transduction histidine kinase/CheY-like chemotaxis protein
MGVVMQQLSYSIEGDSETAGLARRKDWRTTPLGPVEQWPQSLRTSLSICLACRFPIVLIWGPEMVVLYNDAFIPVLGNQHPAAMGGSAREVWADVWQVVGPMLQSVLATGQAVKADDLPLLMKRNGYDEETYFSFSYSLIADETCGVGGIFTPVFESSEKVIGHRRIELLRMLGSQPRANTLLDACDNLAAALAGAAPDLPFGMIYTIDAASGNARLAASFGLDEFPDAAPREIAAGDEHQLWQVVPAVRAREQRLIEDLDRAGLALPGGAWGAPVAQALAIPIATPGQDGVVAVLVAAVSPHRELDGNYRSFYKLLADQVQGTLGAALSYEAQRKRALALAEIDRAKTTFFSNTARMEAVFRQAPAAIALLQGPGHVFELANPLYQELVGNRDLLHKPIRQALPELEGSGVYELLDGVYRTGKPHEGHAMRADLIRGQQRALHECYFDFVYQPMLDAAGAVEGIAVVVFEVTETVQAKRAAEQASRAKDEFIAILGHELRNPLAPIVTALEVMKLRGIHLVQKEHGIIERQAQHLVGLVNDLLDVARVSRGKVELRRELTEAAMVVACAVETASPLLEERRNRLLMEVPKQGLALDVDRQRVSQVLANLLTNAAKYSDNGSEIHVCAWRDGRDVVLEVRDSGRGIAGDMLPHVFDMFYQDPQSLSRSRGGLGLGLTIVRSLVELHGGTVSAASAGAGRGSTFTVRLPAADPHQDDARCGTGAEPAADESGMASILVVDDNVDAAETLRELLQMMGYAVEIAFDGPSALRKLDRRWPDVAVLDIGLPGMDGYELAALIRQEARPIQLVALSGYGQESDTKRALAAGFDRHLTKPVSFDELEATVGALVARVDAGSKGGAAR